MPTIRRRTTGVLREPKLISKEIDELVKQINKGSGEQAGKISKLEAKAEVLTGDALPTNKTGKDGDVFIHTVTKVVYIKLGGIWS